MRNAAYFIASQGSGTQPSFLQSVYAAIQRAVQTWRDRQQVSRLVEFDDHMLSDIGLSRNDVQAALDLPFLHDPSRELQIRAKRNIHGWNA